jgi:putrescine aminotransferase
MTTLEAAHDLVRQHQSSGQALLYRLSGALDVEVEASGSWVVGSSGQRYLDLGSYAVFLLGHGHPRVVSAVADQVRRLAGSSRALPAEPTVRAVTALAGIAPPGLSKVMLLNSGAEAVEAAIKLARVATGRTAMMHLANSFHGKTTGALSLTDAEVFRGPFQPLLSDVHRLDRTDPAEAAEQISRARPAAVFAEPVQGEGGVFELSADYLRAVRKACDEAGTLLVYDEIQSGLGRCGTTWAYEGTARAPGNGSVAGGAATAAGSVGGGSVGDGSVSGAVTPDVLLSGKALGGGAIPASALLATPEAFRPYDRDPLLHTSTFGGNPLAAAAVAAAIDVVVTDDVPARAVRVGAALRDVLDELCHDYPHLFTEVSGRGALLGLHCRRADIAGTFLRGCFARHLLVTPCLTAPSVVRLTPSVFMTDEEIAAAAAGMRGAAEDTHLDLGDED